MLEQLGKIEEEIKSFNISNPEELESFRLKYLSRNGLLSVLFDEMKKASKEEKAVLGKQLNNLKKLTEEKYGSSKENLSASEKKDSDIDLTLPGRNYSAGREHLVTKTLNEFVRIFREIGFKITVGQEIEDEFHNFDALNTPEYHPARDQQDTFYVENKFDEEKKYLLRTHTSPVQIRTMLSNKPPIRILSPGKVFRNETVTPKNYFMFHQVEGLYVDTHVTMRDLKGVLNYFVKTFFEENTKTRFRPCFFPFTEPSAEMDVTCFICSGKGCRTCKHSGWLELGGCGMVHPKVFEAVGYDSEEYSGYAFGFGVERIALMKYGIGDIRLLYQNDIRFLNQF